MARFRKLVQGLIIAAGLVLMIEAGARALWGAPPSWDTLERTVACEVQQQGDRAWLACRNPGQPPAVAPPKGARRRVVVVGGSSVRDPFKADPNDNFPEHLQRLMPDIEVLNFGVAGMSMAGVAWIVSQLAPLAPDVVVIYEAHNDYAQTVFQGSVAGTKLWMIPIQRVLARSWIHAALARPLQGRAPARGSAIPMGGQPPAECRTMPDAPIRGPIPTDDDTALALRAQVHARFQADLSLAIRASPAPVIVSTVLRNFDYPPGGVLAEPDSACGASVGCFNRQRFQDWRALAAWQAELCGADAATTQWLQAHVLAQAGDHAGAVAAFRASLAQDPVPLRAPLEADDIIRQVAAETGATLLDLSVKIGELPEATLFTDTLHPSTIGAERIAQELAPLLRGQP